MIGPDGPIAAPATVDLTVRAGFRTLRLEPLQGSKSCHSALCHLRSQWDTPDMVRSGASVVIAAVLAVLAALAAGCGGSPQARGHPSTPVSSTTTLATGSSTSTSVPAGAPTTTSPPASTTSALPTLTIASWTGRDPVTIYFSGDGGNVATGLTWSVWNPTEAIGHGTRQELSCVPDCAQGTATAYPVTLTLGGVVGGGFTSILEQTADGKGTAETFTSPHLAQGVCATDDEDSCVFVVP